MKSWVKGMLIGAGVCIGAGCIICAGGRAMGGSFLYFRNRSYGITEKETRETAGRGKAEEEAVYEGNSAKDRQAGLKEYETEVMAGGETVRELEIHVTGGRVEIVADDSVKEVTVVSSNEDYRCRQEKDEDKLEIYVTLNVGLWQDYDYSNDEGDLAAEIRIPADARFREVEMEVRGGLLLADQVSAEKLGMELEAGMVEVSQGSVDELDGECKAGELIYRGEVNREMKAECLMGRIGYQIAGSDEDFSYELEVSAGSILIDGEEQGIMRREAVIGNPNALKKAELECKTGIIEVEFE